ncbi:hypothetical protein B4U80_04606 [Leptotrombidium deliense]|uniref:Angiotensin-converting enzyme n=1 Tax=Leptotrombidium deliense TaxID=299467 RepID=A0A443SVQ7_9ACAR|nr:hypothetical protein B4U80_04606 [Leptotrombidium deliense]
MDATAKSEALEYLIWKEVTKYDIHSFTDTMVKRQLQKLSILGSAALGPRDSARMTELVADMENIYGSAKICVGKKCELSLEPDVTEVMARERDYDLLKEAWINWRDETGKKMRQMYTEYVNLGNKMAIKSSHGSDIFRDFGEYWLHSYEDDNFKEKVIQLWNEVEPFYKQLHAFVRMKLRIRYGSRMPKDGTIPAHLLGNMWAQSWTNIMDDVTPYPDLPPLDVTDEMHKKGFNSKRMFEMAEEFFVSLGLDPMTDEFWNKSMFVKPENKEVVCHASAWNMGTSSDFRIKMCSEVNMDNLIKIHHEMGHIVYYMLYKDQPFVFRDGANPAFHEALGDVIALSVSTPDHLKKVGLLEGYSDDDKGILNFQLLMALDKVAFLPFGFLIDLWRWDVFANKTSKNEYNKKWWQLRLNYQGVSPPGIRNEEDFDPGSKYHIPSGTPYIGYFVSYIIQFQFHKTFCELANQRTLHECDIFGSKEVGEKIREVFSQGSSTPWQQQLLQLTNQEMSAKPLLEYFQPLRTFLKAELKNEKIGWKVNQKHYGN